MTQSIALVTTPPDQLLIPTGDDLLVSSGYCLHNVARITSHVSTLFVLSTRENFILLAYFSSPVGLIPKAPFYGSISSSVIDSQLCSVRIHVLIILE